MENFAGAEKSKIAIADQHVYIAPGVRRRRWRKQGQGGDRRCQRQAGRPPGRGRRQAKSPGMLKSKSSAKRAEMERLTAEEIAQREIEKQRSTSPPKPGRAHPQDREGRNIAFMKYQAEAEGMKALLEKKAEGSASSRKRGGDSKAAATMLMIEKLEAIVARQTEAISKLKIDKITVWDSASGEKGSSTANFISSLVKSLPPVQDVAAMAGMELPEYLGKIKQDEPKQ